jgi:hypothetical protein
VKDVAAKPFSRSIAASVSEITRSSSTTKTWKVFSMTINYFPWKSFCSHSMVKEIAGVRNSPGPLV